MINPYGCYIISFLTAIVVYQLGWSDLYPILGWPLVIFLMITVVIHLGLSLYWTKKNSLKFTSATPSINPLYVTIFIYSLWCIEFIYEGGVPLLKILLNKPYDYRLFGVPSLHVFVVTFSSFYTIYLFHTFISRKKKVILLLYFVNLSAALLIYSRAMLFFNLLGSLFIYLLCTDKVSYKKLSLIIPIGIILFYFFGVLGNLRVSFEAGKKYDPELFLETGKASSTFRNSSIPPEFFWTYIYVSSPLANLQHNVMHFGLPEKSAARFFEFMNNEFLFDFISKRVNHLLGIERESEYQINGPFNVSTVYSRSYSYFGWPGIATMALFVIVVPLAYRKLLSNQNQYALTGIAILCTMYLFLVYDNTIRFTGLGFQLIYPVIFFYLDRIRLTN